MLCLTQPQHTYIYTTRPLSVSRISYPTCSISQIRNSPLKWGRDGRREGFHARPSSSPSVFSDSPNRARNKLVSPASSPPTGRHLKRNRSATAGPYGRRSCSKCDPRSWHRGEFMGELAGVGFGMGLRARQRRRGREDKDGRGEGGGLWNKSVTDRSVVCFALAKSWKVYPASSLLSSTPLVPPGCTRILPRFGGTLPEIASYTSHSSRLGFCPQSPATMTSDTVISCKRCCCCHMQRPLRRYIVCALALTFCKIKKYDCSRFLTPSCGTTTPRARLDICCCGHGHHHLIMTEASYGGQNLAFLGVGAGAGGRSSSRPFPKETATGWDGKHSSKSGGCSSTSRFAMWW